MKTDRNWFKLVTLMALAALFLMACERPLPGGYNGAGEDVDMTLPDSGAYPTETEGLPSPAEVPQEGEAYPGAMPEEAPAVDAAPQGYPAEDAQPAEAPAESEAAPPAAEDGSPAEPAPTDQPAVPEEAPTTVPEGETAAPSEALPATHTVVAGENLYRISLLYGISWTELAAANNIANPADLAVGQVLTIPAPGAETAPEATPEVEEAAPAEEESAGEAAAGVELPTTYVVQQGDNLFRIGLNFGIDWNLIVAANGIINNFIYPGQELIIPAADGSTAVPGESETTPAADPTAAPAAPGGTTHIVQAGETVFGIAFQYGVTWTSLVEANALPAPYTLEPGQSLVIPAN